MTRKEFKEFYKESHDKWLRGEIGTADFSDVLANELGLKDPKTEIVYEWYFKAEHGLWYLCTTLRTEEQAAKYFISDSYKKTGRSFEVPCE